MKKNLKQLGRVSLSKEQVFHFGPKGSANYKCFICGKDAMHQIREFDNGETGRKAGDLYLCTIHFVRLFKLPANRHPKMVKSSKKKMTPPQTHFLLRRHMNMPLEFDGAKLLCYEAGSVLTGGLKLYFTLYSAEVRNQRKAMKTHYLITITAVNHERKKAIPFVGGTFRGFNDTHFMRKDLDLAKKFFEDLLGEKFSGINYEVAATSFLTEIYKYSQEVLV